MTEYACRLSSYTSVYVIQLDDVKATWCAVPSNFHEKVEDEKGEVVYKVKDRHKLDNEFHEEILQERPGRWRYSYVSMDGCYAKVLA